MKVRYMGQVITIVDKFMDMLKAVDSDGQTMYIPRGAFFEVV